MLDKKFTVPGDEVENNYDLRLKRDLDWAQSKHRLLIVLQTVDGLDLKNKEIASTPALINAIKFSRGIARKYNPDFPQFSFGVVNFNNHRHLHLKGQAKVESELEFKARVHKIIAKLNPTHILFSGDLNLIYPVRFSHMKNGWVHEIDGRKVTSTLDFARLLEKQGTLANLLGFWCRHLANLLIGYLPHSCKDITLKPVYVDTVAKFDKVMALWDGAKLAAVDTETKNLSVLKNAIYTIQFAFDQRPETGFVLPIDHPHESNPFAPEDRKYIKRELRKRFAASSGPELITFNGMFDLRIIRRALKLPIIYHTVWEVMAGEHDLDENISSLASLGIKGGGLAAVLTSYGNDFYINEDTKFSKAERSTTGSISPSDQDFLKYGSMDVVSILHIRSLQIDRAKYQDIDGKNYQPFFVRHMRYQMSDTAHQLSHLKETGSLIDKTYLRSLTRNDSVLAKAIGDLNEEFKTFPEVVEANKQLLVESGFKAGSLFGGATQWVFSFTKASHKLKLFIDICKLEAVSQTKTGQDSIDKEFIDHYKDRSFLVAKFGEFQGATKLLSTYVKGWYKQLTREVDGATDDHLRADYGFFQVDSGRLNSGNPNLQNIPARGKLSKIIKEMFVTADGCLQIRFDYSAHEVRGWSIVAGDEVLANAFKEGQKLRKLWIKNPTDEIKTQLKTKGDIHIQNVKRFFGKWVEKSDPLRDAVKAVVFGTLYGKAAQTLGNDTKKTELDAIKAKIAEAYKANNKADLKKLEVQFNKLRDEDRSDNAQHIIDKMFNEFKKGHQWVLRMQRMATEKFYVYSPIGRIRHLYAAMTQDKQIVSRQVRRGMNAPIQGFASEIAVKASRRVMTSYYKSDSALVTICKKLPQIKFNRIVHDALYYTVPFEVVLPFIHIMQYEATYGVAEAYHKEFGLKFTVEPEIELEIGSKDTNATKWDWSLPNLVSIIDASVDAGIKDKIFTQSKEEILEMIYAPWKNPKTLKWLDTNFPLLGVSLVEEIKHVVNASSK